VNVTIVFRIPQGVWWGVWFRYTQMRLASDLLTPNLLARVWLKDDGPTGQMTGQWGDTSSASSSGLSLKIWLKTG